MMGTKLLIIGLLATFCVNIAYGYYDGDPGCEEDHSLSSSVLEGIQSSSLHIKELLTKGFRIANRKRKYQRHVLKKYDKTHRHERIWGSVKRAKSSTARYASCRGSGILETSRLIAQQQNLTRANTYDALRFIEIPQDVLSDLTAHCQRSVFGVSNGGGYIDGPSGKCLEDIYRSASGVCNNPRHFTWGAAQEAFQRLLPPDYEDGLDAPRGLSYLPNPRTLSLALMNRQQPPKSEKVSQMLKVWGQFVDHDVVKTPETSAGVDDEGETIDLPCCDKGNYEDVHFEDCLPIRIPFHDDFFKSQDIHCLRFVRALPFSGGNLLNPREQLTEITAFIDASNVYGSSDEEQHKLRTLRGGRLKVGRGQESSCTSMCPLQYLVESDEPDGDDHFLAGDGRANEQPSLASMHTIWLRMHNLLAKKLATKYNDDEEIFQKARKVVIALMQHITYTEFLPVVLGPKYMKDNGIATPSPYHQDSMGYDTRYDVSINPGIFNVFGAAAFRFGHTLISNDMGGKVPFELEKNFFNAKILRSSESHPSDILHHELMSNAEDVDAVFHTMLISKLLAKDPFTNGTDLMALNIMRGRDHGIPGYNQWRRKCGLKPFHNFYQMKSELDPVVVKTFAEHYNNVEDVDLFPAGLAEKPTADGILGPTFSCIILKQFGHLKYGDRFWYENGPSVFSHKTAALSPGQLQAVRKFSLAHVLCLTTSIESVSIWPMQVAGCGGGANHLVSCEDLRQENLVHELLAGLWLYG